MRGSQFELNRTPFSGLTVGTSFCPTFDFEASAAAPLKSPLEALWEEEVCQVLKDRNNLKMVQIYIYLSIILYCIIYVYIVCIYIYIYTLY